MKKKLYYITPFVVVPLSLLLCELLDNTNLLPMSAYMLGAVLLTFSVIVGFLSPARRIFDYWITAMMPLSLFCCMFVGGFLDKDDLEARFHFHEAINAALQPVALVLYVLMATATFLASFRYFRNVRNRNFSEDRES